MSQTELPCDVFRAFIHLKGVLFFLRLPERGNSTWSVQCPTAEFVVVPPSNRILFISVSTSCTRFLFFSSFSALFLFIWRFFSVSDQSRVQRSLQTPAPGDDHLYLFQEEEGLLLLLPGFSSCLFASMTLTELSAFLQCRVLLWLMFHTEACKNFIDTTSV